MKYQLTNHGYMALGIYIGFKAAWRRPEMAEFGVDYDKACAEFTKVGLMKAGRINLKEARIAFGERFPNVLGSQTHMYCNVLGYSKVAWGQPAR